MVRVVVDRYNSCLPSLSGSALLIIFVDVVNQQVIGVARTCNLIMIVLDAAKPMTHKRIIEVPNRHHPIFIIITTGSILSSVTVAMRPILLGLVSAHY
jgi:hypothetical protein